MLMYLPYTAGITELVAAYIIILGFMTHLMGPDGLPVLVTQPQL